VNTTATALPYKTAALHEVGDNAACKGQSPPLAAPGSHRQLAHRRRDG